MTSPERMDAFEALVRATSQEVPLHAAPHAELHPEPEESKQKNELADQRQYDTSATATASEEAAAGSPSKPPVQPPSEDVRHGSPADGVAEVNVDVDVSQKSPSKAARQDTAIIATKTSNLRKIVDGKRARGESPTDGSPKADVKAKSAIDGGVGSPQFKVKWGDLTPADLLLLLSPTVASSVKVKPTGGGPYVCGVCEKRFPSLNALDDHDHLGHGNRRHGSQDVCELSPRDAGLPRGGRSLRKGRGSAAAVAGKVGDSVFGSTDRLYESPQGGLYRSKRLRGDTFQQPTAVDMPDRAGLVRRKRLGSAAALESGRIQDKVGLRDGDAMAGGRVEATSPVARGYKSKRSKIIALAVAAASASDAQRLAANATAAEGLAEGAHSPDARERSNAEGGVRAGSGENGARAENKQAGIARRKGMGGGKGTLSSKGKSPRRGRMTGITIDSIPGSAGGEARASTPGSAEAWTLGKGEIGGSRSDPEDVSISELLREGKQKRKRTEMSALEATQHLAKCQASQGSLERGEKKSMVQFPQSSGSALGSSGDLLSLIAGQQLLMQQAWQKQHGERQHQDGKQPDVQFNKEENQQDEQQERQQVSLLEQIQEMLQLQFRQQQQQQPPPLPPLQQQYLIQQPQTQAQYSRAHNMSDAQTPSHAYGTLSNMPSHTSLPIVQHPSHTSPVPYAVPPFRTPSSHSLAPSPPPLPPPLPAASAAAIPAHSPAPATPYSSSHLQSSTPSSIPSARLRTSISSFPPTARAEFSPPLARMSVGGAGAHSAGVVLASEAAAGSAAALGAPQGMCGLSGEHALRSALVSAIVSRIEQMTGQGQTQAQAQLLSQLQAAQALLGQGEIKVGAEMQTSSFVRGLTIQQPISEPAIAANPVGAGGAWAAAPGVGCDTVFEAGAANAYFEEAQNNGGRKLNGGRQGFRDSTGLDLELRL